MKITAIKTDIFQENDNLVDFIFKHVPRAKDRSVLVVTSKIVAIAEGRTDDDNSAKNRERLIKAESQIAIKNQYENTWLTVAQDTIMTSAGIDESNAQGKLILLPSDSYASAKQLCQELMKQWKLKHLGVVITDSRVMPLRAGAIGMSVGYAGLKAFKDYRGQKDIFGRKFVFETSNIPDALAAAAVLEMGEGREQRPLAVIEEADIEFADTVDPKDILISKEDDLYKPLLDFTKFDD